MDEMFRYIVCMIFGCLSLFGNSSFNKYIFLGINGNKTDHSKRVIDKIDSLKLKSKITIQEPKVKRDKRLPINKIFQYTKFKKLSDNKSLCGICMDYKISKRVQLSVDILAQINRGSNSITIEDGKANIKVAMSL